MLEDRDNSANLLEAGGGTRDGSTLPTAATPLDAEVDVEVLKAVPKAFAIDCEEHANWLVRRIIMARAYASRVKQYAEQELRRAEREEQTLLFLFGRQIEAWAQSEIAQFKGRRKSLALPAGTVGFRKIAAKLVIDDEKVVLVWAKENCPSAVVVIEKLSKSVIDEQMRATGVVPDAGAHVEPEAERFYIR
jgi:hypothetical protein